MCLSLKEMLECWEKHLVLFWTGWLRMKGFFLLHLDISHTATPLKWLCSPKVPHALFRVWSLSFERDSLSQKPCFCSRISPLVMGWTWMHALTEWADWILSRLRVDGGVAPVAEHWYESQTPAAEALGHPGPWSPRVLCLAMCWVLGETLLTFTCMPFPPLSQVWSQQTKEIETRKSFWLHNI